jgi:hypothetical protein
VCWSSLSTPHIVHKEALQNSRCERLGADSDLSVQFIVLLDFARQEKKSTKPVCESCSRISRDGYVDSKGTHSGRVTACTYKSRRHLWRLRHAFVRLVFGRWRGEWPFRSFHPPQSWQGCAFGNRRGNSQRLFDRCR